MRKELLEGLTEEQIAKLRECKSVDEILAVAKEEGVELNEEQLAAVSGGGCVREPVRCPICNSDRVTVVDKSDHDEAECHHCGYAWRLE